MDGGATTDTTDRLDLLWHIQWIPEGQHLATLKVAYNLSPDSKAIYHRVPMTDDIEYRLRRCH
jgi:hypothetical protein